MKKKTLVASTTETLAGLPQPTAFYSRTINHPDFNADDIEHSIKIGAAFADTNDSHKKGECKKVAQHSLTADFAEVLNTKLVESLTYKGVTYRWYASEITAEHKKVFKMYRTASELNGIYKAQKALNKRLLQKIQSASYDFGLDHVKKLQALCIDEQDDTFTKAYALIEGTVNDEPDTPDMFQVEIG
jgi:hypothetical protein